MTRQVGKNSVAPQSNYSVRRSPAVVIESILMGCPSVVTSNRKSRPHAVGHIARGGRGDAVPLALSALCITKSFLAPQPLDLLVIDDPVFAASVTVCGPEPRSGCFSAGAYGQSRRAVAGSFRGRGRGSMALIGACCPGDVAGQAAR